MSWGFNLMKGLGSFLVQGFKKALMILWIMLLVALLSPFAFMLLIPIILLGGLLLVLFSGVVMLGLGMGWGALTGIGQWLMNGGTPQMQLPWVAV